MAKHAPVKYVLAGAGISALGLVVLQSLLAQRLERAQIAQMGPEVAFNLRLGELALDRSGHTLQIVQADRRRGTP